MEVPRGRLPTGTVTFLFSDIEDSTRLVEDLGTTSYRDLLEQHNRLLRKAFTERGGVERGTEGDSFLVVFTDAPSAVAAAVEAQLSLEAAVWPDGAKVRVRMGLHSGTAIRGGDDYIGLDINRAARIASAAHGAQVLISDSTRALSEGELLPGVTVRDVGEHRLKGIERPVRLFQLVIEGMPRDFPPPRTPEDGVPQLPTRLTSFVGRQGDLDMLPSLLETNRLVTLIGPAGTGKTTLAIELARRISGSFADGARFVDLAPLDHPDLVPSTVARRLGLRDQPDRTSREALEEHLASREVLLVLDNFEHVLVAAELVTHLLAAAPRLSVLATSRRPLGLYGEQEYPVPSLPLPEQSSQADVDYLSTNDAVTLFVERARSALPAFAVSEENVASIAQICIRLDGLPLAIELAASQIRLLTPQEILGRLDERHPTLTRTDRGRPARHQTLQAAIEWSYDLADPVEQKLFVFLSVFAGGFTHEAADRVCNQNRELGIETLDGLESLIAQSLVRHEAIDGGSRFAMLETIRDYGRHRLASTGHSEELRRRHLDYFADLAVKAEPHLLGTDQGLWLNRIEADHANLRLALRSSIDAGDAELGLRLASATWRFWLLRGYLSEGRSWLEELLALEPDKTSVARASGYTALGGLTFWLFDPEATEDAYKSAQRIYEQIGDDEGRAETTFNLAYVPTMRNRTSEARRRFEASLALANQVGLSHLAARSQIMLGILAVGDGDPVVARSYFQDAQQFFQDVGDQFHLAWATRGLGSAYLAMGRNDEARSAYLQGLRLYSEVKALPGIGQSLREISGLASSQGHHLEAVRLAGAAALRETIGASAPLPDIVSVDVVGTARDAIGDEVTGAAFEEGRCLTVDDAVEYAVSLLE